MAPVSFHPSPQGTRPWGAYPSNLSTQSHPTVSPSGKELSMQTVGKTDWWRTSYEWRSTGASYMFALEESEKVVLEKESKKELTVGVKLDGKWEIQLPLDLDTTVFIFLNDGCSDQAALFLYLSDSLWMKTGIEFTEGQAWVSVVVTNRWSDWSLRPIPIDAALPLKFELKLQGHHLRVFLNGEMTREVNGFAFDITPEEKENIRVGVMGCSPIGDGTTVTFNDFKFGIEDGVKAH